MQPVPVAPTIPSDAVRFSDLPADSKFYFVADANRSFLWIKTSDVAASNTVNQKVANIPVTTYVRAEASVGERPPAPAGGTGDQLSVDAAYESRYGIKNRRIADGTNAPAAQPRPQ